MMVERILNKNTDVVNTQVTRDNWPNIVYEPVDPSETCKGDCCLTGTRWDLGRQYVLIDPRSIDSVKVDSCVKLYSSRLIQSPVTHETWSDSTSLVESPWYEYMHDHVQIHNKIRTMYRLIIYVCFQPSNHSIEKRLLAPLQ